MAVVVFDDGPAMFGRAVRPDEWAEGFYGNRLVLRLSRLPVFLRVVRSRRTHTWDALDQVEDVVCSWEGVWIYRRQDFGHARRLGRFASYVLVRPVSREQVARARENETWRQLVEELPVPDIYGEGWALHG